MEPSVAGGPSFLAYRRQSLALRAASESRPGPPCGAGLYLWCEHCQEVRAARCGRNRCVHCGPVNALRVAGAIALARPERIGLLTLAGRDWQTVRRRAMRFAYRVRQRRRWSWCYHVEPNPSADGEHHVHWVQWGDRVPVAELRSAAEREGFGSWVGIHRIKAAHAASFYGLKLAGEAYGLKLASEPESLTRYLDANGGRMVHASRGFWRDLGGVALPGVRAAVREAAKLAGEGEHAWRVEYVGNVTFGRTRGGGAIVSDPVTLGRYREG